MNRAVFPLIVLFWLVMNALLWRSEFRGGNELGSAVPVEVVWQKILTAPDDSALEILHRGNKVGYCRWRANVGEEIRTGKVGSEDFQPEGMVKRLTGYTIDLEGNLLLVELGNRIRFDFHGDFATDHRWEALTFRAGVRPKSWELRAVASTENITVVSEESGAKSEHAYSFGDFRDPGKLLRQLGLGLPFGFFNLSSLEVDPKNLALGLTWEARNDWLQIGHAKVRVYRLQARLLDRYQVVIVVSRVGEILRVDLPNEIGLVNDALINL